MNYTVWRCCLLLLPFLLPQTGFSRIIYGLDQARHFNGKSNAEYQIQAGSFLSAGNAQKLKNQLSARFHYPVWIMHKDRYYRVMIGPLNSAAMVRAAAQGSPSEYYVATKPVKTPVPRIVHSAPTQLKVIQESILSNPLPSTGSWLIRGDLGAAWANLDDSMTVDNGSNFPSPQNVDQFSASANQGKALAGIVAAYQWQRGNPFIPAYSLGLRYQHLFSQTINGTITQYSLPEFLNYSYHWKVETDVLSLYSKVNLWQFQRILPYVDAGIGIARNHSSNYQETAFQSVTPRISPAYGSHSEQNFAWNAGLGIDYLLTSNFILSLGYDYQSFGNLSSGPGQTTWSGTRLDLGNFNANTAFVSLSYLVDRPKTFEK